MQSKRLNTLYKVVALILILLLVLSLFAGFLTGN